MHKLLQSYSVIQLLQSYSVIQHNVDWKPTMAHVKFTQKEHMINAKAWGRPAAGRPRGQSTRIVMHGCVNSMVD